MAWGGLESLLRRGVRILVDELAHMINIIDARGVGRSGGKLVDFRKVIVT
jgi:hypothetical protein